MPLYDFLCPKCNKEISIRLTIKEREREDFKCPDCGEKKLTPLFTGFFCKTSKKS